LVSAFFFLYCFGEMAAGASRLARLADAKLIAFDQWLTGVNPPSGWSASRIQR
jgi:hypothetical protein